MAPMYFDCITARQHSAPGAIGEGLYQFLNVFPGQNPVAWYASAGKHLQLGR